MRLNLPSSGVDSIWKLIHRSRTLPRIKSFLWLVCKDRVLTNAERLRRHIANTAKCVSCGARVEDLDHLLQQCPFAKEDPSYFATDQADWDIRFGAIIWNLWRFRNRRVFDPDDVQHETVESCSQRIVAEVGHAAPLSSLCGRMVPEQRSKLRRPMMLIPPFLDILDLCCDIIGRLSFVMFSEREIELSMHWRRPLLYYRQFGLFQALYHRFPIQPTGPV
ncbi:hypothetical protein V6N11_057300 [Hibiscus sabdariffa]